MIVVETPNTDPYLLGEGNTFKIEGAGVPKISVAAIPEFCICDFIGCEYVEKVFGSDGSDYWKKDKSDFLFKKYLASDTIEFFLYKDGVEVAELNDDTLGTFYDGFPSGNEEQQIYKGFLIDWSLVLAAHGSGDYYFKADLNVLGEESEYESRKFYLMPYSDLAANGTVRFESYQDGNIFGIPLDYTGLNWYSSLRINGSFGNPRPILESDEYENAQKVRVQIKETVSREWELQTKKISWEVVSALIYNGILANEILVSDYNILAENVWRRIEVKTSDVSKNDIQGNPNRIYNITFVDREAIFEKRNF